MADKKKEDKIVLEREYTVPIRKKANKAPQYKRTNKAIKILKEFVERHMTVRENPHKMIKLDKWLNEEMWQGSMRRPPHKIRIKCKKFESGKVLVELSEIPEFVKWRKLREEKSMQEVKKIEEKKSEEKAKKPEESKEEKKEDQEKKVEETEKKDAVVEAGMKQADLKAKQAKHESDGFTGQKQQSIQRTRKAMQR